MLGIEKLRLDQDFQGDVILLEPSEDDLEFFHINPLAFWRRAESALYGFVSVKEAVERHYPRIDSILSRYCIRTDLERLRRSTDEIRRARYDGSAILDVLEAELHPRRPEGVRMSRPQLRVVGG